MLFSEPKIPQTASAAALRAVVRVSVLFSEPKIPQSDAAERDAALYGQRFSALQRAENSSKLRCATAFRVVDAVSVLFSEPKIPQIVLTLIMERAAYRFSALQRAENSSNGRI